MKKGLIVAVLMLATVNYLGAQKLNIGIKAGVNGTQVSGTSVSDAKVDLGAGYEIGAFVRLFPGKSWFIQPEVNYAMKQSKFSITDVTNVLGVSKSDIKMSNVQIPVLLGYRVLDLKVAAINLLAGPVANFVTSATLNDTDMKDSYKAMTVSGQAGVSVDVLMFVFGARYEFGLTNMLKDTPLKPTAKNNSFVVSVGYKFM